MAGPTLEEIIDRCRVLYEDLRFESVRAWKAQAAGRRAIGFMPFYVPREIIHAAGMLPVGILGGGDQLEVIHGDAYYQSYICRIPRSTLELALGGRLDCLDGMLFPSTCDVIRNLSGMWQLKFPDKYARYFDLPQNYDPAVGGVFFVHELRQLRDDLAALAGHDLSDADLRRSIETYNAHRRVLGELYDYRADEPWQVPTSELYLLLRAGLVLPVEEHTAMLRDYLAASAREPRPPRDNCRVVLTGMFCEQPPLGLIKSIEMAGCYVVDDDYMLVHRWLEHDVPGVGDPLENLARAYLEDSLETASKYVERREDKGRYLIDTVRARRAEGVVFAAPSFCDPALLERPMLQRALAREGIPYTAFKYAENSGQMAPIREQAGTFADSLKLWS
jgi:benzoyl-CoA reductase subunit C